MANFIKKYSQFNQKYQDLIIDLFNSGNLKSIQFPFKGKISDGFIYEDQKNTYIIPKFSIPNFNIENIANKIDDSIENLLNEE